MSYTLQQVGLGSDYTNLDRPNGVSFSEIETQIYFDFIVLDPSGFQTINYSLIISPQVGFAAGQYGSRTYTVGFTYLDETVSPPVVRTGSYSLTTTYTYSFVNPNVEDTTPPIISPFGGSNEIVFNKGAYTSLSNFWPAFFSITEPDGGGFLVTTSPPINFSNTLARTSITLSATNKDGYTSNYSFFLTIQLAPSQTPPSITGPDSVVVYVDENLNNTSFLELKGYTITGFGTVEVTFSPPVSWTNTGTYNTTITAYTPANDLSSTKSITVLVQTRPIDASAPVVTRVRNLFQFFKSQNPSGVSSSQVETAILQSFVITDTSSFTTEIIPTVTGFDGTTDELRGYQLRAIDALNNTSPYYQVFIQFVDDTDKIAPTITGPNTVTFVASQNRTQLDILVNYILSDNSDPNPQWYQLAQQTFNVVGTYNYLLRAIDSSGNIASRTIQVIVVAQSTDTVPPVAFGPASLTFREADNITVADIIPYFTVTDNVSARANITYTATSGGSSLASNYQFPIGVTSVILRFADEANNLSLPLTVNVIVIDDELTLDIDEDAEKLQDLTSNHLYSAPIVSIIRNTAWKPISWLVDPVQVNYTIDGLSDEININFLSRNLDTRLEAGELVRVVFDSKSLQRDTWGLPTYDSFSRPLNHDVMIVESGNMVKNGNQNLYRHNYKLVELINILKDYRLPTLTFTSFTESTVIDASTGDAVTYYSNPYNAFTILERAIKLAKPNTSQETNDVRTLIQIEGVQALRSQMIGVDHQFEEATLYDVVTEIARIIGKTPVLYLNPLYGESNPAKYLLFFESDREHSKAIVSQTNILQKASEYIETTLPNRDKDEIVVDAHNVIGSRSTFYPSDDLFTYATALDQELPQVGEGKQMVIVLPNNISQGVKVKYQTVEYRMETVSQVETGDMLTGYPDFGEIEEIPLIKYNEWLVLDPDERKLTAYYKENENIVYLPIDDNDLFTSDAYEFNYVASPTPPAYNEYKFTLFQVEYFPVMDFQARIGDGKQTTFNQINSMVDSETLGTQVYYYRKGNESGDITVSKLEYAYDDILKPTQLVEWDGELYHIVSVSFNSSKTKNQTPKVLYKVAYQLNKEIRRNFNLNAPTNQREYQIPYENVFERYDVIKEKVKLHFTTNTKDSEAPIISELKYLRSYDDAIGFRYLLGAFEQDEFGYSNTYNTIETVAFRSASFLFTNPELTSNTIKDKYILAPVNKTIFGNSLLINFQMPNNVYAGTKIILSGNSSSDRFNQRQVSYVDPFGKIQFISINYLFQDITDQSDILTITRNFPEYSSSLFSQFSNRIAGINSWEIDKDSREKLNVTLQIDFEGVNGTKIGTEIVKGSSLYQRVIANEPEFKIVRLRDGFYNPNDLVSATDFIGAIRPVTQIAPISYHGIQIIMDDDYTFDTTSTYALVELLPTVANATNYKIVAIMGDRSSLVETDRVFIYF
jgi:hypothetical protein